MTRSFAYGEYTKPDPSLERFTLMRRNNAQDWEYAQAWASRQEWWPRVVKQAKSDRAWTWFCRPVKR